MMDMASGFGLAERRLRFDYHALIGWGVSAAGITGAAAWLAGRPFLTSDYGYVKLRLLEAFELATAMGFDLGVFLTVVGAVRVSLATLSRLARPTEAPTSREPMDYSPAHPPRHETATERVEPGTGNHGTQSHRRSDSGGGA